MSSVRTAPPTSPPTSASPSDERRVQLAESALATLGELGYARASLREIAARSPFSHGVVHYYFRDKHELIVFCVRHYKARCVRRYDGVVGTATTPEQLLDGFAHALRQTLLDEAPMHRLWYDLRSQSIFEPALREAVTEIDATLAAMVWRVVSRYGALSGRAVLPDRAATYGLLDGLFQQALLAWTDGDASVPDRLVAQVHDLLPLVLSPAP